MELKKTIVVVIVSLFFLSLAYFDTPVSKEVVLEKISMNLEPGKYYEGVKVQGDAHSGEFFSRIDGSGNPFGMGYCMPVDERKAHARVKVIIDGWARTNMPKSHGAIVITTNKGDSMVSWTPIWLHFYIADMNKWSHFIDSTVLPTPPEKINISNIKAFTYISDAPNEKFDIDDFNVTFKAE
ncbi:MAG: hypothetical protein ACXVPQ_03115 [Bacteroidia bacterium]